MSRKDHEFDAATLRAELDGRWPDAEGVRRATTDETHRLALLHPEYDGFLTLHVTAHADVDGVFVLPSPELASVVTSHHRTGPLERGQVLPIDLELHPGNVRQPVSSGTISLVDASGEPVAADVRFTFATDAALDCVLAGAVDGPFGSVDAFEEAVGELADRRGGARRLARRLEALEAGGEDPGWGRLPWRRR